MPSAVNVAKDLANYNNQLERSNVALQYGYNKSLAEQDRAWQERMSNSAHQREIKDLKAAGLNPVLSVTGGNGAATGSGSSTQVSKPNVDMSLPGIVMDWATAQLNSATQLQRTAMEVSGAYQRSLLETGASIFNTNSRIQADKDISSAKAQWDYVRHIMPSGNSVGSQLASIPYFVGLWTSHMRGLYNSDYDSTGEFLRMLLGKDVPSDAIPVGFNGSWTTPRANQYSDGESYTNIDDLISSLSGKGSKEGSKKGKRSYLSAIKKARKGKRYGR